MSGIVQMRRPGETVRVAVLDDYMGVARELADWSKVEKQAELVIFQSPVPVEELADFDVICLMRERMDLPVEALEILPRLSLILSTGRHTRTLDLAAAQRLGIAVIPAIDSGNGGNATVELAWGLILSLMRHLPSEIARMRTGGWQKDSGKALCGRTLGLIGLGRLGGRMAALGRAFGMNVIAWSPNLTPERAVECGATAVQKQQLFSLSDVISLHLVLGDSTRGIVGGPELALMRPDAVLVNTSRGPLIDETALIDALRGKVIAGAALDVFATEPLPDDSPLRAVSNLILTPHLGYAVEETLASFYRDTVTNLLGWLETVQR